jgi:hypothetical protein
MDSILDILEEPIMENSLLIAKQLIGKERKSLPSHAYCDCLFTNYGIYDDQTCKKITKILRDRNCRYFWQKDCPDRDRLEEFYNKNGRHLYSNFRRVEFIPVFISYI